MVDAVVDTVTATAVALDPFRVTMAGTEHVASAGAPAQASVTVWLSPPAGATARL